MADGAGDIMSTFGRIVKVTVAGLLFESPPFTVEFELPFSDGSEADVSNIKLYNLSDETTKKIAKGDPVVVQAGYEGDVGTVALGTIEEATTAWQGVDKITTLLVGDGTNQWLTARVNRTWRQGVKASEIAKDIIDLLGLSVGQLKLPNDAAYPSGKTFATGAKTALEEIARDCGAKLHVTRQAIYLVPPDRFERVGVVLTADTGLLDSPEPVTKPEGGYKIRTLLQHRITTDAMVEIRSRTANGQFRVIEGRHRSSMKEHVTEATVVPV